MSPSGSLKKPSIGAVTVSPTSISSGGIWPTATGAWLAFSTVAVKADDADRSPGSVAVTVIVAVPGLAPTIVTSDPETDTAATLASSLSAEKVSTSPSGVAEVPGHVEGDRVALGQGHVRELLVDHGRVVRRLDRNVYEM